MGTQSLAGNTTGINNTASGFQSLFANTTGINNVAVGTSSLPSNTTGFQNTAIGTFSLFNNITGSSNTAIGFGADISAGNLTNATAIGEGAIVNASNKVRIGNGAVTVIEGQVPFTTPSDGRFKYKIKEDVKGLDFIMQLRQCRKHPFFVWPGREFIGPTQYRLLKQSAQQFFHTRKEIKLRKEFRQPGLRWARYSFGYFRIDDLN